MNTNYNNSQVLSFNQEALQATRAYLLLQNACFELQWIVILNLCNALVVKGDSWHQGNLFFRPLVDKAHSSH